MLKGEVLSLLVEGHEMEKRMSRMSICCWHGWAGPEDVSLFLFGFTPATSDQLEADVLTMLGWSFGVFKLFLSAQTILC